MGYYTQYSLKQLRDVVSDEALATLIAGDESARGALRPDGDSKRFEKWYEHEECLCAWSAQYPTTIFRLHGEGEDSDGIWDKYFLKGRLLHTEAFNGLPEINLGNLSK
jgi:hypothetical protein